MGSSERMANAPVYYALTQVKFSPVQAMSKYVAEIQDALRLKGYPLYEQQEGNQLKFEFKGPDEEPQHVFEKVQNWLMINQGRTEGFILGNDFLSFHTANYDTREPFINTLMFGLQQVIDIVKPGLITRLGMRYLDAVLPNPGEDLEQYLVSGLHGAAIALTPIQSITESVFQTKVEPLITEGILVNRVHKMHGRLGFPPDLGPNGVVLAEKFRNKTALWHAIIDTDHYVEGDMPPDVTLIEQQLRSLHASVKSTFDATTTDFARAQWA